MTQANQEPKALAPLMLAALGVVFGDIGTSPLYAFKEAFAGSHGLPLSEANVLATLSALFWAVTLIISFKYVFIVLRFDNEGEGGALALASLAQRSARTGVRRRVAAVTAAGVFAAAMFYGDAVITPAISVLSAVEGIAVVTPTLEHWIEPITIVILVLLFCVQRTGTAVVGRFFGPITIVWFAVLALLGASSIAQTPEVLRALNPAYAVSFAIDKPGQAFLLLGAVFLALTGGEALYADMGHFGRRPVRLAWNFIVSPALLINYFGQGALVLRASEAVSNPFFMLAPEGWRLPLVGLATMATVIASQATISGAFSITAQATRLGYLPRLRQLHTSDTERGQVYIPAVNWMMLVVVVVLVLEFDTSSELAAAYGIAVSGVMIITTLLMLFITTMSQRRLKTLLLAVLGVFLLVEMLFFASNLTKFMAGGWLPMLLGGALFTMLTTWKRGTALITRERRRINIPMADFIGGPPLDVPRVPGTAIYLTSDTETVPSALFHNLKHFKVLHERVFFLHVMIEDVPRVPDIDRIEVHKLGGEHYTVEARYGFREEPDIPKALAALADLGLELEPMSTTYFVARATVVEGQGDDLQSWRRALFGWMMRQSEGPANYFHLPPNQVVELGTQISL
ncbi:potassium transporter Kup [Methyloversatilis discipulorum]|uniref:potassium transporter Kup n=1 Tax=Methyloversatilis discipulorum TaxID=1119528 RepID=UPI0003797E0B|nr:potassium transporter Kup [Methyloversatilis discipulorum]